MAFSEAAYQQFCSTLAEQGLTVRFSSKATTASIDPTTGVIILPTFQYLDATSGHMLASHECGHAIHTIKDGEEILRLKARYGALFNILEDGRIERLLKVSYPGLVKIFEQGYRDLNQHGFFSHGGKPLDAEQASSRLFVDRLNLHLKMPFLGIQFSKEESAYVSKAMMTRTHDDVVALCEEIKDFLKQQAKPQQEPIRPENVKALTGNQEPEEPEEEEGNSLELPAEGPSQEAPEEEQEAESQEAGEGDGAPKEEEAEDGTPEGDSEANQNEESQDLPEDDSNGNGETTEETEEGNPEAPESETDGGSGEQDFITDQLQSDSMDSLENSIHEEAEKSINDMERAPFEISSKKYAENKICTNMTYMMGLFDRYYSYFPVSSTLKSRVEMAKKAAQIASNTFNRRLTTANIKTQKFKKTGSLNMSRLAHYKTSQNIFKKRQVTKGEKNHAMIIGVDLSGSMRGIIQDVLFQTVVACEFCLMNGIPFEVIGFGAVHYLEKNGESEERHIIKIADSTHYSPYGIMSFTEKKVPEVTEFGQKHGIGSRWTFYMGDTPTAAAIISMIPTLKAYNATGVDKTVVLIITDGDYNVRLQDFEKDYINSVAGGWERQIDWTQINFDNRLVKAEDYMDPYYVQCCRNSSYIAPYLETVIGYIKEVYHCQFVFSTIVQKMGSYFYRKGNVEYHMRRMQERGYIPDSFVLAQLWNKDLGDWPEDFREFGVRRYENCNTIDSLLIMPYTVYKSLKDISKTRSSLRKASCAVDGRMAFEELNKANDYLSTFANLLVEKMS